MEFRLLGPLEVLDAGREIAVGGHKRRSLLALLLLHRNEVVPADRLIDELWDGRPPATAAKGLQVHVSQLRKELVSAASPNGTVLLTRASGYVLQVPPETVDIVRFERAVADGERARAAGQPDVALARLREGLELWRGPPLVDFAYEAFAQDEIARLEALRLVAIEERTDANLALGRHHQVVADLEALVQAHPLHERLRGQLMLALYRCGRRGDALDAYREARAHSVEALGLEPGPALRALEGQILEDDPGLATPRRATATTRAVRRSSIALVVAGVLVGGAALGAFLRGGGDTLPPPEPALDIAANSVAAIDVDGARLARFALPLPGRPTDIAAAGDRLFAVSVDSSALTVVDGRTRRLARTIPLRMRPSAIAVADDTVWVADGRRGLLVRLDAGYEKIAARATWRRPRRREEVGLARFDPTAVTVANGAAWATDGTSRLVRADHSGRVTRVRASHRLDAIAAGAGAVWASSREDAAVVRVDPVSARITDEIRIAARPGSEAPAPIALAATGSAVWVLNGNTATVSRIDARTLGVTATIPLSLEQNPRDIDAGAGAVWVSSFDGTVTRIPTRGGESRSSFLRGSLVGVAGSARRVWLATIALDQQIPGGE